MPLAYEILVVDLDGTLLAGDGTVSAANRAALDRARAAGMIVIVATGRSWSESGHVLEELGHDGLLIAAGGSVLTDIATGRTIERHVMPHDVVTTVTTTLDAHGHKPLVLKDRHATGYDYLLIGTAPLDPASSWWFEVHAVEVRSVDRIENDPDPDHTLRTGAVARDEDLAALAGLLRETLGDAASLQHWPAVTSTQAIGSPTHLLEVFHPAVNKWTMVLSCCERFDVDPRRVAAIGDGLNDVELVSNAGLGVAMGNADERVNAVADRVTEGHNEDGVASAVERLLAGEW
jgi:hydroxymethylpyrimidine pyrophosphatase-like HAD family hydrolase